MSFLCLLSLLPFCPLCVVVDCFCVTIHQEPALPLMHTQKKAYLVCFPCVLSPLLFCLFCVIMIPIHSLIELSLKIVHDEYVYDYDGRGDGDDWLPGEYSTVTLLFTLFLLLQHSLTSAWFPRCVLTRRNEAMKRSAAITAFFYLHQRYKSTSASMDVLFPHGWRVSLSCSIVSAAGEGLAVVDWLAAGWWLTGWLADWLAE